MSAPDRMAALALQKRILQQRSALLRRTLAAQVEAGVSPLLGGADRVMAAGHWLRQHPALLVGASVALLVWRPKGLVTGVLSVAGRGLWLWQTWQKLQPVWARLSAWQGEAIGEQSKAPTGD